MQVESLNNVDGAIQQKQATGLHFFDSFLQGGIIPGLTYLLAGKPGAGKSSLLLQLSYSMALQGKKVLYISGEQPITDVKNTADRIGAVHSNIIISRCMKENGYKVDLESVQELCVNIKPSLLIVDSLQMLYSGKVKSKQLEYCSESMIVFCQAHSISQIMINHSTKSDLFAGTQKLQHMVDATIGLSINTETKERLLFFEKYRNGSIDNPVVLIMGNKGLMADNNDYNYNISTDNNNNTSVNTDIIVHNDITTEAIFFIAKLIVTPFAVIVGGTFGLLHGLFIAESENIKKR